MRVPPAGDAKDLAVSDGARGSDPAADRQAPVEGPRSRRRRTGQAAGDQSRAPLSPRGRAGYCRRGADGERRDRPATCLSSGSFATIPREARQAQICVEATSDESRSAENQRRTEMNYELRLSRHRAPPRRGHACAQPATPAQVDVTKLGPQVGDRLADFRLKDQSGREWTRDTLMGSGGLMLVFSRSADWCPYCKTQLVELQSRAAELSPEGNRAGGHHLRLAGDPG